MLTLIIGGAASGKSEYAEDHVLALPGRRVYLATMEPFGAEALERIGKHRVMRAQKGFETVEQYVDLTQAYIPPRANLLLECMSNLVANERYSPQGGGIPAVLRGLESLMKRCDHLTIVTNEVFSGGSVYAGDTLNYLKDLAEVNRWLAARADLVVEIVCGLPNVLKGDALL